MRVLGLDVGDKTIGIALSDPLGITAQGIMTLQRVGIKKDTTQLIEMIAEKDVDTVVVGYPRNMDGSLSIQTEKTLLFKEKLANKIKSIFGKKEISVVLWDERLTTVLAERMLIDADVSRSKRKKVIDKVAAINILQSYLDSNQSKIDQSKRSV